MKTERRCETCRYLQEHEIFRTGQACNPIWLDAIINAGPNGMIGLWPVRLGEGYNCPAWVTATSGEGPT